MKVFHSEREIAACQVPNDRPNWGTGTPKNIWISQTKGTTVSQNILGLPKQILMALYIFFLFHGLVFAEHTLKIESEILV